MLGIDEFPAVAITWKREAGPEGWRYWSNYYPLVGPEPLNESTAALLMGNLATGEQFMHTGDVEIFGIIAYPLDVMGKYAPDNQVFCWPEHRFGNRTLIDGDVVIPFQYALTYSKETLSGKSGRVAFRRCLTMAQTVPYKDGGLALKNHLPGDAFHSELVRYWLNNVPIPHAIFTREDELQYPTTVRAVEELKIGSLIKLDSIEDAQARKTLRARPYQLRWQSLLYTCFQYVREIEQHRFELPEGMKKESLEILQAIVDFVAGEGKYLVDYWTEGIKPEFMLVWRPTSGLDPLSLQAQNLAGDIEGICEDLNHLLSDMNNVPDVYIDPIFSLPFALKFSWLTGLIERIGVCRWTGTPLKGFVRVYD